MTSFKICCDQPMFGPHAFDCPACVAPVVKTAVCGCTFTGSPAMREGRVLSRCADHKPRSWSNRELSR